MNSEHIVTLYIIIFILHIFNNFPNILSTNLYLTHIFITNFNLNLPYYITQFKQYPCFLKLIWNSDKLENILSRMICKYLSKHTFFPKHSINLLNLKSSIFTSVTNSTLHTQISFHSCNTPYTFIFYLCTKTPMYATINFSLPQSTFSTLHHDPLYISNINFYKNSHNTKLYSFST